MGIGLSTILAFVIALTVIYVIGSLLVIPIRIIIKLILNGIVGGVILLLVNLIGGLFGINIVINALTATIAGFFGVPGVVFLIIVQLIG